LGECVTGAEVAYSGDDEDELCTGPCADRREVLETLSLTAGTLACGMGLMTSHPAFAATDPASARPRQGDRFVVTSAGALQNQLVRPDLLPVGKKPVTAYPIDVDANIVRRNSRLNRMLVLRLDPEKMDAETKAASVEGVLAYSAVCTHKGCTIAAWRDNEKHLRCHCHLSEFAALSAGEVMTGPASRPLPYVPLTLDSDGRIMAKKGFNRRPGRSKN